MSNLVTVRLARLADHLGALRARIQDASRLEVAHAIADALGNATQTLIAGRDVPPSHSRHREPDWDDPWDESECDAPRWHPDVGTPPTPRARSYDTALLSALATARWTFTRTGHPAAALGAATIVALAIVFTGDRVKPFLDVFLTAQDLLDFPRRRP